MNILGIETSCDETSVALLDNNTIIANEIHTQKIHALYGGVVPEIASRAHMDKINALCEAVFQNNNLTPDAIDLIAVTDSPGLAGALLVGISFALGMHGSYGIPVTGINHLEGHICSVLLEYPAISFPFLAMVVSGGHTSIYRVNAIGSYECLGETVDDAAGEAFDKIGKMLGFTYPAGGCIGLEAARAPEGQALIQFPVARVGTRGFNFSFSGLKTSVKYYLQDKTPEFIARTRPLICKSFQKTIIDSLAGNLYAASCETGITTVAVVGGVACNTQLRERMHTLFGNKAFFPALHLCTDNAAMIARAGYERALQGMLRFPRMAPAAGL
jgi:N6-L-threonylcarbamoyladenine synthase